MSAQSRWLRINIDWDDSDWVAELSVGAQLAWIKLLCHVKREGSCGRVKALSANRAAQKWGVNPDDITALLEGAARDNAVMFEDGHWVVVKWAVYQPTDNTNTDRQKRHREKKQAETNPHNDVIQEVTPLSRRVTGTGTETDQQPTVVEGGPREEKSGRKAKSEKVDKWESAPNLNDHVPESHRSDRLGEVWRKFVQHRKARGVDPYTVAGIESVWGHMKNQGYTGPMIPDLIERCMAQNWKGLPPEEIDRFAEATAKKPTAELATTGSAMNNKIDAMTAEIIRRRTAEGVELNAA